MKNIYNTDGTDRADRKFPIDLHVGLLDADFSSLFSKVMKMAANKKMALPDGRVLSLADLYRYQPFVICAEIASLDITKMESLIPAVNENMAASDDLKNKIVGLFVCMEDWRARLEWNHLKESTSYSLLGDITEQIRITFSSYFQVLLLVFPDLTFPEMSTLWRSAPINALSLPDKRDFLFRLGCQLVAFVKLIQSKMEIYRDEILSDGKMDPSLSLMVTLLTEYGKVVSSFNRRFLDIPDLYYGKILGTKCRPEKNGRVWISVNKTRNFRPFTIAAHTILSASREGSTLPCRLLSDLSVGDARMENVSWLEMRKSKERHPEADLGYVTSLSFANVYPKGESYEKNWGISLKSSVLRMSGGHRCIEIHCSLTKESVVTFKYMLLRVAVSQRIDLRMAANKILNDNTFRIFLSTASGFFEASTFLFDFDERNVDCNDSAKLIINLDSTFPSIEPFVEGEEPELRLLISNSAWLFPYSWCRKVKMRSIKMNVRVEDSKNFQIYNDLGQIDITQPFCPFGNNSEKGAWFAVGSNEMASKRVSKVMLSMDWRGLPKDRNGLRGYYDAYNVKEEEESIDNASFLVQGEYLSGYEWKPIGDMQYMFRTEGGEAAPQPDMLLSDKTNFNLSVRVPSESRVADDDFVFGSVPCGFYRFVLVSPEMGFGEYKYRRLFAETMMMISRTKRQLPLPQHPIQLMADAVCLTYEAEANAEFVCGGSTDIKLSYVHPLLGFCGDCLEFMAPISIVNGQEEGGRVVLSFSNMLGAGVLDFYLDMESLMAEVDDLPVVSWLYRDGACWRPIKAFDILSDETNCLLQSGHVSFLLPKTVTADMLDERGLFWISALVEKNFEKCAAIRTVYTNVALAEVEREGVTPSLISGVDELLAISQINGHFDAEDENARRIRIRERICHRNRALLADDYEMLVLQHFPEVDRVKCISHVDTKYRNRTGIVTVVLMRKKRDGESLPLFTDAELREVEKFLKGYVSPFVEIDAINPEYEEVTLFCGLKFREGVSSGEMIDRVERSMNLCVAPWLDGSVSPTLGKPFSVMDLRSAIRTIPQISALFGLKVIQVVKTGREKEYERRIYEWTTSETDEFLIAPSSEWTVLKPADVNYVVSLQRETDWRSFTGVGDFEVGDTFVIEKPSSSDGETMDC